jgi:hypothetical protein
MRRFGVVGLAPLLLAACGGGSGNGTVSLADLPTRLMQASCAREVRCGVYPNETTCEAAFSVLDFGQLQADVTAGRTKYDGKAVADCLAAFDFTSCSETAAISTPSPSACRQAIQGTLGGGAACYTSDECVSGNCDMSACVSGASCCAGTCTAPLTTVAIGADCSSTTVTCPDGSFCQAGTGGAATVCVAKIAAGQPCTNLTDCAPGTVCVNALSGGASICGQLPGRGSSCTGSQFCDSPGDYCDFTTGVCTARVAPGGACPTNTECVSAAVCDMTTSICVALGLPGAACTQASDCLTNDCVAGACVVKPAAPTCP